MLRIINVAKINIENHKLFSLELSCYLLVINTHCICLFIKTQITSILQHIQPNNLLFFNINTCF